MSNRCFNFIEIRKNYLIVGEVNESKLTSFEIFGLQDKSIVGNIYRGRILNKIKSLNAYFVDIGIGKNGFLQIESKINTDYNEGDEIIVQVTSPADGEKGVRLRDEFEIKGINLIITPFNDDFRISKKILDIDFIEELKTNVKALLPKGIGAIVRTSAQNYSIEEINAELRELLSLAEQLDKEKNFSPTPKLLMEEDYITDSLNFNNLSDIFVNDKKIYDFLLSSFSKNNVIYDKSFRIKDDNEIFRQIKELFDRKVILDNGIELIFEKTEALYVVDINSSGFLHKKTHHDIHDVNIESLINIIKQIVFRNIYGIILVDFISYKNKIQEEQLLKKLYKMTKLFKNPPQIVGFTRLGILEITRNKKVNNIKLENITLDIF